MHFKESEIIFFSAKKRKKINLKKYIEKNSSYLKNKFLIFCSDLEKTKLRKKNLYETFEIYNKHNLWECP